MATPFLKLVAQTVFDKYKDSIENLCIVLPNKRAGLFLKQHLANTFGKTIWLPKIIGAEEFFTEISGLKILEEVDLICHLYESYRFCYGEKAENFDSFSKWGQLILQDFNEIDRFLADPEKLYENLKDIKEIENWSLGAESLSEYQKNYLAFMNSLGSIYKHFNDFLSSNKWAYQGAMYKRALEKSAQSGYLEKFEKILFCGFNALNAVELKIITRLVQENKAELIWDADAYYLNNIEQEAGFFLRRNFELFSKSRDRFIGEYFKTKKKIQIISVPKQIGQAQVVKQKIQTLIDANVQLDKVAIVLANEKLLWPILKQLPESVEHVNITMEYPIQFTSAYSLLETLLNIQLSFVKQSRRQKSIYHKDLVQLLREPLFVSYLEIVCPALNVQQVLHQIQYRNLSFISATILKELFAEDDHLPEQLLAPLSKIENYCQCLLEMLEKLIGHFSKKQSNQGSKLELEYMQVIQNNINRLIEIVQTYPHFNNIYAYKQLFIQVIGTCKVPFIGEPLKGLQIMGLLESRTLDFDHLILVNANEGILPSGKGYNSFIPNDLKQAFELPLYQEKDAVYAYHFYRLLQRASDVLITYDSETDGFGKGEKSRFVTQILLELNKYNKEINIIEEVASYDMMDKESTNLISISKSEIILKKIYDKAQSNDKYGALSPSSLITFKECALKFYFRYGVKLKETEEVEESAEANTLGSILHLSLENLYKSFVGSVLQKDGLSNQLKSVDGLVHSSFISFLGDKQLQGKSILQEEVLKVYVKKQIQEDISLVNELQARQQHLSILALEQEFTAALDILIDKTPTRIYLKGKIDRIDLCENKIRVIDYKTSVKKNDKFIYTNNNNLFNDVKWNKQFQLFLYAWILYKNNYCEAEALRPCIIAFKEYRPEPFYIKTDKNNELVFTKQLLDDFEKELAIFIEKIFLSEQNFDQTEEVATCEYCSYNVICNRQLVG